MVYANEGYDIPNAVADNTAITSTQTLLTKSFLPRRSGLIDIVIAVSTTTATAINIIRDGHKVPLNAGNTQTGKYELRYSNVPVSHGETINFNIGKAVTLLYFRGFYHTYG